MKRILVTTDFSELADLAIAPAADLAKRLGGTLIVAHVVAERPPKPDPDAPYYKAAKAQYELALESEANALRTLEERTKVLDGVDWKAIVGRGTPVAGTLHIVDAEDVDMIVMSSQGRTGLKRLILGSVAEELTRSSPVPVLIWKEKPAKA